MSSYKRRQLFVDPKVQGALLLRTVSYWLYSLLAVGLMLLCWRVVTLPGQTTADYVEFMWFSYAPAAVASLCLLPIVAMDCLRLSNRFAGPVFRLRRAMKALSRGQQVKPIHFREGDYWKDFAEDFNMVSSRLEEQDLFSAGRLTTGLPSQDPVEV